MPDGATTPTLGDQALARLQALLAGPGLDLDLGCVTVRLGSHAARFARQLQATYAHFPLKPPGEWADLHVRMEPVRGLRRWLAPQVTFFSDGAWPYEPFPGDSPLPLFEWGVNGLLAKRLNHLLLLHAGVVERDGRALVMPAMPGSGKSTLTAALALSGWRLLSDEFGALDPDTGRIWPLLKPVALKNESIGVIRRLSPGAAMGPSFPKTRKGTVAHLAAPVDAVKKVREPALPGLVVLPKYVPGSATAWEEIDARRAFNALAFNAFNYEVLGERGFRAVLRLMRECPARQLVYSDLGEALALLDTQWRALVPPSPGSKPGHGDSASGAVSAFDQPLQEAMTTEDRP